MNHFFNSRSKKNLLSLSSLFCLSLGLLLLMGIGPLFDSARAAESQSRTESNCTIGMVKDDKEAQCHVPILKGCTVAQFPGYDEPWAEASKGGATSCQFDTKKTDWKTAIVGTCEACKTEQCTGRFTVMFNCTDNVPSASPAFPQPK